MIIIITNKNPEYMVLTLSFNGALCHPLPHFQPHQVVVIGTVQNNIFWV